MSASKQSIKVCERKKHTRTGSKNSCFSIINNTPRDLGAPEVEAFLTDLAVNGKVSASTQTQALSALLFLYRDVLGIDLPWTDGLVRAKPSQRIPMVLSVNEVHRLMASLDGVYSLMARLIYGSGMRLMECVRLRVKDVDFDRLEVTVREGKGRKDRNSPSPSHLRAEYSKGYSCWREKGWNCKACYYPHTQTFFRHAFAGERL